MNNTDLPPLPALDEIKPEVCTLVKRYLAISSDLSPAQRRLLSYHLQHCAECAQEWKTLDSVTRMVAHLEASQPSSRVDQAVMLAIAASTRQQARRRRRSSFSRVSIGGGIAACVSIAAVITFLLVSNMQSHFQLPASLSWNTYVLYHSQTMTGSDGKQYRIQTYHNMATDQMNVETSMGTQIDVQVVSDSHQMLGMDMMQHVAQWDTSAWSSDDSAFNLEQLRSDLQTGKAIYQGKDTFKGQTVYRIRTAQGNILLLDSHYMPVNILETNSQQVSTPMYEQVAWLSPTKVPNSMWQMDVPQGFKMGQLPSHPKME